MKKPTLNSYRIAFQIFIALAFIIIPILNRTRYSLVYGNFLSFHLFGIPVADPLAVLQLTVKNFYLTVDNLIGAMLPLILAYLLGTVFCSWVCPYGLFSELTQKLSKKLLPPFFEGVLIRKNGFPLKLLILWIGFMVFLIYSTTPLLNQLSAAAWYARFFQYLFGQDIISLCFLFLLTLLVIEFFARRRLWCRYICPQSVLIILAKMLNKKRLKVAFIQEKCICKPGYERCLPACHLTLNPKKVGIPAESECSNCGACVVACRKMGKALSFDFPMAAKLPTGQRLAQIRIMPNPGKPAKNLVYMLVVVSIIFGIYYGGQRYTSVDRQPDIKNPLLTNKKISWTGSRAKYVELLADGTLICVGGDWPVEGFKGGQWQPVDEKGSFKMIFNSKKPADYTLIQMQKKVESSTPVIVENFSETKNNKKYSQVQAVRLYESLQNNHRKYATAIDARVILNRYANEVYNLDLIVYDPGGKKIQRVFSEGDLITTEGMLTAVHRWINSPVITASEGKPPRMPIHTRMTLRYRGEEQRTEVINFVTEQSFDQTDEVFEDLWF